MSKAYFKGFKKWHSMEDFSPEVDLQCNRCGFSPKMTVVTVDEKFDSDPDCNSIPQSVQDLLRKK